jgi:REP element-mobilizing transposase RayT
MDDLYNNKYRIDTARLKSWDYSADGYYFVTICTKNRECYFGRITDAKMVLSEIGYVIFEEWTYLFSNHSHTKTDEWIIMPNHLHAIIIIENSQNVSQSHIEKETSRWGKEMSRWDVSTRLKPNSLGSIIGQFKSRATKRLWNEGYEHFAWQLRFYDHIIRNERELLKIREYIRYNPINWHEDEENPYISSCQ